MEQKNIIIYLLINYLKNHFNSKSYNNTCVLLNKCFNFNNLDNRMRFLYFDNYINPLYNYYT